MLSTLVLIYLAIALPLVALVWTAMIAAKRADLNKERNLRAIVFRVYTNRRD